VTIDDLRPAVTLLVDQSGSMREGFPERGSELTRWKLVRQALLDPKSGVVPNLQSSIQFGLVFYTSHNGFSGGGTCPILNHVESATNNEGAITALYDSMYPDDDTPTGAAVRAVVAQVVNAQRKGPELILLVTDGDPDTCQQPDPQDGQAEAISAADYAHRAGIDFYVLGISSDISGDKLQQLANAGQGKRLDAVWGVDSDAAEPFQASSSVAGFTAQLRSIVERVPLCSIELERPIIGAELDADSVKPDGKRLERDAANGFQLTDPRHLEVLGKACDQLRASGKRLSVRIACDAEK
jgi:hypothetical protein